MWVSRSKTVGLANQERLGKAGESLQPGYVRQRKLHEGR